MTPALQLSEVCVENRIADVSLAIDPGSLVGLIGPNGSGKSTVLQVAAGLLPSTGRVRWSAQPLDSISILERGRRAAWVPQEAHFEFGFTVRSVVAQARFAHGDDERGVDEALAQFELTPLAQRPVNRLSGGERQRVLLARACATDAPLQLWDEPLAALDPRHALELLVHARRFREAGKTVLLSLHDLRLAHCLDLVVVMDRGKLRACGRPEEVMTPDLLREVFGVKARTLPGLTLELP